MKLLTGVAKVVCVMLPVGLAAAPLEAQTVLNPMPSPQTAGEPQLASQGRPVISPEFGSEEPAPRTEPLVYEAPDEAALSDNVVYSASYGSWSVICIGGEFNSRECHTETSVFRRDYAREPVVILRITPTSASPTGLAMALSTPNNVLLQLNANLSIAGSTFVAPYTICDDSFCTARVDISQELLARLLQNRAGFVAFTNPPSSEVYIPLEFGGLLEAISDLNQQLQVSHG